MKHVIRGAGPPLLLLPGLGCDDRLWDGVAERLEDNFTLVLPHVWGRGPLAERARELESLAGSLRTRAMGIAGLSMGGYLAFECLRHWPQGIRAVALLDTTAFADNPERVETRHQVLRLLEAGAFEEVLRAFVPSVLAPGTDERSPAWQAMLVMARDLGPDVFAADMKAILGRGDHETVLGAIRVPALFVAGSEDQLTPLEVARRMAAEVPGAAVAGIEGAGHMPPLEAPAATASALQQFFTLAFDL